jgi:ubiquinone/menaquinone biosynthesis C-methylase UbiE
MRRKIVKKLIDFGLSNEKVREKWLEDVLQKIPAGQRILDAGAGELKYKKFCSHLDYITQDFAQYDGSGDGSALQTGTWDNTRLDIISDITDIPLPNASLDAIMCVEVFEHLPEPIKAIKEFSRLLKNKGKLIVTAPFCSLTHFAPYHFYSGFNTYFYEKHLIENGFRIVEIQKNGDYFEYLAQEIIRLPAMAKRYSQSRLIIWHYLIMFMLLKILKKLSKNNRGSQEVLYFGCHILAEKIS